MERKLYPNGGGSLQFKEERGRVTFEAVRPDDKRGLYKLRLYGRGKGLDLGALVPEEGVLRLQRSYSVERLKAEGCWPVTDAEVILAVPFGDRGLPPGWSREEKPARLLYADKLLERCAAEVKGAMVRKEEDGFQLAFPYAENLPFALAPLFCLARVERMGEKHYVVYTFREGGAPCLPT